MREYWVGREKVLDGRVRVLWGVEGLFYGIAGLEGLGSDPGWESVRWVLRTRSTME